MPTDREWRIIDARPGRGLWLRARLELGRRDGEGLWWWLAIVPFLAAIFAYGEFMRLGRRYVW